MVFGEIEDLAQCGDVGGRSKIHRSEAEQRFIEHAQPGTHRWPRSRIASVDTEVHGDVEHLGPLGVVHAQKEDVGPGRVGEIHPHRCEFAENGIGALWGSLQEFWPQSQWLIGGMAHAEHPLVAPHGSHTASHLIGEGLESQSVVSGRQGRSDAFGGTLGLKLSEKAVDGLLEAAVEEMFEAGKRDQTCMARGAEFWWKVKSLEGRQKEQGPHPFVQILGLSAEPVQGRASVQQLSQCGRPGPCL